MGHFSSSNVAKISPMFFETAKALSAPTFHKSVLSPHAVTARSGDWMFNVVFWKQDSEVLILIRRFTRNGVYMEFTLPETNMTLEKLAYAASSTCELAVRYYSFREGRCHAMWLRDQDNLIT